MVAQAQLAALPVSDKLRMVEEMVAAIKSISATRPPKPVSELRPEGVMRNDCGRRNFEMLRFFKGLGTAEEMGSNASHSQRRLVTLKFADTT